MYHLSLLLECKLCEAEDLLCFHCCVFSAQWADGRNCSPLNKSCPFELLVTQILSEYTNLFPHESNAMEHRWEPPPCLDACVVAHLIEGAAPIPQTSLAEAQ